MLKIFRCMILGLFFLGFIALCQAQEENQERARELFEKGVSLGSGRPVCSEEILRQKEYFYKKAIELYPAYAQAHNNLGDVYENLGRYREAIAEYEEAIRLKPDAEYPYFGLGDVYFKMGRYKEAIKWYDKGLKINPRDNLSLQRRQQAKDMLKQGIIEAKTIKEVLSQETVRSVGGIRNSPSLSFHNIQFAFNSAKISTQAIHQLNEIGKALSSKRLSKFSFKIAGHTDSRGTREYNQWLSERRAESVKDYLERNFNISSKRLITVGYGEDKPIAFGDDEVSHALNRRVEIEKLDREDLKNIEAIIPQKLSVDVGFLYEDESGKPVRIKEGMILTSDDNYKIYFKPHQDCYIYIYQQDSSGKIDQLFPNTRFCSETNPVKDSVDYWVPAPNKWFYLDETKGRETIYLVAVNEQAYDLEYIASRYEEASFKEKNRLSDEIVAQIKTRGLGGVKSPPSKIRLLKKNTIEKNGGFYTKITFIHK